MQRLKAGRTGSTRQTRVVDTHTRTRLRATQTHASARAEETPGMSRVEIAQDRITVPGPLGRILRIQLPHGESRARARCRAHWQNAIYRS